MDEANPLPAEGTWGPWPAQGTSEGFWKEHRLGPSPAVAEVGGRNGLEQGTVFEGTARTRVLLAGFGGLGKRCWGGGEGKNTS